jgi:hypothetical protein
VHNSEEKGRRDLTPQRWGTEGGETGELKCEAKGKLSCSKELKVAWTRKQGWQVKPTRESECCQKEDADIGG